MVYKQKSSRHFFSPVRCLPIRARVGDVVELLETTTHNAFPVVDKRPKKMSVGFMPSYGRLRGLVSFYILAVNVFS